MPTGKLKTLIHLSQQSCIPNTRLVPDHNDKGYGVIEDADGRDVYFTHLAVAGLHGFDDLRKGQQLDYTLEDSLFRRATAVKQASTTSSMVPGSAA